MASLTLEFSPTKWTWQNLLRHFLSRRKKTSIPQSYSDLTRDQAIRLARVYMNLKIPFSPSEEESMSMEQRFACLQAVLDLNNDQFFSLGELAIDELLQKSLLRIEQSEESILTGKPVLKYISAKRIARGVLPNLALSNAPLVQFNWAEEYYQNLSSGLKHDTVKDQLDGLVSVLCLTPRRRIALWITQFWPAAGKVLINWSRVPKWIQRVPADQKFAVLMYYFGTRQELRQLFSPMFSRGGRSGKMGIDFTSKYRLWALTHDLAEKGVFGGFDATCYTNLHDVLHHCSYNSDKYREYELKQKINGRS